MKKTEALSFQKETIPTLSAEVANPILVIGRHDQSVIAPPKTFAEESETPIVDRALSGWPEAVVSGRKGFAMSFFRVASVSLLFASGCAGVETSDVEQHIPVLPPGGCEEFGCGTNSPEVDNLGMHDVHGKVAGAPNANGFVITSISKAGVPFKYIWSQGGSLKVWNGAGTTLSGGAVQGTSIIVHEPSGGEYELMIKEVGRTPMWGHVTGGEFATTYRIDWDVVVPPGQKRNWRNVCSNPDNANPENGGMDAFSAVVFELDEIDAVKKTVTQREKPVGEAQYWFNIGCAGHALAKLHLTGHTTGAAVAFGFHTDNDQRQATLKMFAAAYCDGHINADADGYPFTVAGQPLKWRDKVPYNVYSGLPGKKEAEWTKDGVRCLNTPRVYANPTPDGSAIFNTATLATIQADIKDVCGYVPPKCTDTNPNNLGGNYIVSSNPP